VSVDVCQRDRSVSAEVCSVVVNATFFFLSSYRLDGDVGQCNGC
jgi:hypothetical protein